LKKIEEKITIPDTHPKIQLKPKGFFHNHNKGVNGLLNNKVQISLLVLFKEKIGILTAILPEEIVSTSGFLFRANGQYCTCTLCYSYSSATVVG
jgi:hypothetical protein